MKQSRISLDQLQNGQIWQMQETNVHIELVGKRLVHYKVFNGKTKRSPISLAGKAVLTQYLNHNKATLAKGTPPKVAPAKATPPKAAPVKAAPARAAAVKKAPARGTTTKANLIQA